MKTCTKCKQEKPLEEFSRDRAKKDGLRPSCKTCDRPARMQYAEKNRERKREYDKQYNKKNRERKREYDKQYREKNKERIRERDREKMRRRRKNNPEFRLKASISSAFRHFLNGNKEKSTSEYLKDCGYTRKELMKHLENQFDQSMNWDNYGSYWHIDHIIPQSAFDYKNEQHLRWCWSLENLRPLEASENILKADKIIQEEVRNISFYEDVKYLL